MRCVLKEEYPDLCYHSNKQFHIASNIEDAPLPQSWYEGESPCPI